MTTPLYSTTTIDRAHLLRDDQAHLRILAARPDSLILPMAGDLSLAPLDGLRRPLPPGWLPPCQDPPVFLGLVDGQACFAQDMNEIPPPTGWHWQTLRSLGPTLPHGLAGLLACGRALILWHRQCRFCGLCGHPTLADQGGHRRICSNPLCARQHFPRTDPAVIMRVEGPQGILLHRQPGWPAGQWSILAGFVEPGESLEQAVIREVKEEAGILVGEVTYQASQPWPFPFSLMLGFSARWMEGTVIPAPDELEDAAWFSREQIRTDFHDAHRQNGAGLFLPGPGSISRVLIDRWLTSP